MTNEEYGALLEQLKTDKELAERLKKDSVSILIGPDDSNNVGAEGPTDERIKKLEDEVLLLRQQNALFGANAKTENDLKREEDEMLKKMSDYIKNRR